MALIYQKGVVSSFSQLVKQPHLRLSATYTRVYEFPNFIHFIYFVLFVFFKFRAQNSLFWIGWKKINLTLTGSRAVRDPDGGGGGCGAETEKRKKKLWTKREKKKDF